MLLGFLLATVAILAHSNYLIRDALAQKSSAVDDLEDGKRKVENVNSDLTRALGELDLERRSTRSALDHERRTSYRQSIALGYQEWLSNNVARARQRLEECRPELRGLEWNLLDGLCRQELRTITNPGFSLDCVAWSPDNRLVAIGGRAAVRVYDAATGRREGSLSLPVSEDCQSLAFSPDSAGLAVATMHRLVRHVDLRQKRVLWKRETPLLSPPTGVRYSPDGRCIAVTDLHSVALLDIASGKQVGHRVFADLRFRNRLAILQSPEYRLGRRAGEKDGKPEQGPSGTVRSSNWLGCAASSGDGRVFAQGQMDPARGNIAVEIQFPTEAGFRWRIPEVVRFNALDLSPDGSLLALGGEDWGIRILSTSSGKTLGVLRGHEKPIWGVAFSFDGRLLASVDRFGTAKIWDVEKTLGLTTHPPSPPDPRAGKKLPPIVFQTQAAGGRVLGRADGSIELWDAGTLRSVIRGDPGSTLRAVALDSRRARLATAGSDSRLTIWDTTTGSRQQSIPTTLHVPRLSFSPDGTHLFVLGQSRTGTGGIPGPPNVRLQSFDSLTGKMNWETGLTGKIPAALAMSDDGAILACGDFECAITLVDAGDGRILRTLAGHIGEISSLAFSPAGDRLISGSSDRSVRIWEVATGDEMLVMTQLFDSTPYVRIDSGGHQLVTEHRDGRQRQFTLVSERGQACLLEGGPDPGQDITGNRVDPIPSAK
jgi:WD40 repeat protein